MLSRASAAVLLGLVAVGCGSETSSQAGAGGSAGAAQGGSAGVAQGGSAGAAQGGSAGAAQGGSAQGGSAGAAQGGSSAGSAGSAGAGGSGGLPQTQVCPSFGAGVSVGDVANSQIDEASGLVVSRKQSDLLWVHNDSGDSPRVFAVGSSGADLGEFSLTGAQATDWEDMALGPGPEVGVDYLYLADIGDNSAARSSVRVYQVPEPTLGAGQALTDVVTLEFEYPDGPHNAETLLSDPITGDLLIVTKGLGSAGIYRAAAPHSAGRRTLEYQGDALGVMLQLVTGGDINASGSQIALRTYSAVRIYLRNAGMSVADALKTEPCEVPQASEGQGETVGFSPAGDAYYTLSEGSTQPLYRFERQ